MSAKYVLTVTNNGDFAKEADGCFKKAATAADILVISTLHRDILRLANDQQPLFVLLDLREPLEVLFSVIPKIKAHFVDCRIVGAGQPPDVQSTLELIRMGVKDFVDIRTGSEQACELLNQAQRRSAAGSEKAVKKSKIITFHSPKGGIGVTFLASNVAASLAAQDKSRVAVCDLSSSCGDVATYLNLTPKYTIRDVIDSKQVLDASFLEGVMIKHVSGVRILAGPSEDQSGPGAENINALKDLFSLLKHSYDYIIIDAGSSDPLLLQFVLSQSDQIVLVGTPDVSSLKGLVSLFKKLRTLQYDAHKIKVIMNRYNCRNGIDHKEFENITHHPIAYFFPDNFKLCIAAVNTGKTIAQIDNKCDLIKKIDELARDIKETF